MNETRLMPLHEGQRLQQFRVPRMVPSHILIEVLMRTVGPSTLRATLQETCPNARSNQNDMSRMHAFSGDVGLCCVRIDAGSCQRAQ